MFVGHQMVLDISFPTARERLAQFIREGWLRDASGKAHSDGLVGVTRVGPFGAVLGASKLVQVHIADPVPRADTVIVPLRWEATGVTNRLFPVLDADLALTPAEEGGTLLALMGSYRAPLAGVGSGLDRLVLRRVATATVRSLLRRVEDAIIDPLPDVADGSVLGIGVAGPDLAIEPGPSW